MLFDIAAWVVILLLAWAVGRGVLVVLRVDDLRPGDAFVSATWIGIVVLALALLAASIVAPLTPLNASVVATMLATLGTAVASRGPRVGFRAETRGRTRLLFGVGVAALVVGAAALTSDAVTLYDSLVYHIGIIRWLREHGTVPGLALVHNRLGHVSAWFTLAAPFDHGPLTNRAATIPLGVALLLVGLQTAIAAGRAAARRARIADWFFIAVSCGFFWAVVARDAATPSPDVATNVLIAAAAWAVLVVSDDGDGTDRARLPGGRALIPLLLALGAATMKLFALPAALVTFAFYVASTRESRSASDVTRAAAVAGGAAAVILGPFLAANIAATGCPLFPSPIGCTRAPWSVGAASAVDYAEYIRDVARWDRRGNVPPNDPVGWIIPWITAHPIVTLLAMASPVVGTVLLRRARRSAAQGPEQSALLATQTVVALGLVGIVFAAWQAPAPRFLFAVSLLIPALAAAYWLSAAFDATPTTGAVGRVRDRFAVGFSAAAVIVGLAYGVASQKLNVRSALVRGAPLLRVSAVDLVLPQAPESQPRLFRWRVNDVDVVTPVPMPIADTLGYQSVIAHNAEFEKCSTAPLPCTPYLPPRDVRLRRPERGLAGGFVRVDQPDLAETVATCIGELPPDTIGRTTLLGNPPASRDGSQCRAPDGR